MNKALNGWRRLWIVYAIFAIFPSIFVVTEFWPQKNENVLLDLNAQECRHLLELPEGFFPDYSYEEKMTRPLRLSDIENRAENTSSFDITTARPVTEVELANGKRTCVALTNFLNVNKVNFKAVGDYEKYITKSRTNIALIGIGIWFALVLSVYLIGWAICWVREGFRGQNA